MNLNRQDEKGGRETEPSFSNSLVYYGSDLVAYISFLLALKQNPIHERESWHPYLIKTFTKFKACKNASTCFSWHLESKISYFYMNSRKQQQPCFNIRVFFWSNNLVLTHAHNVFNTSKYTLNRNIKIRRHIYNRL